MSELMVFYALFGLITLCSVMVVTARNPVTAAVYLVFDLFFLAGVYAMMEAHFVAAIQILVYAGAIVVLFMFVIMLLNLAPDMRDRFRLTLPELGILLVTIVGFAVIGFKMVDAQPVAEIGNMTPDVIEKAGGNTYVVGLTLFTRYLWPFELASILILLAIVASVVIAKKEKPVTPARRKAHGHN